jgi:hypothetical protein
MAEDDAHPVRVGGEGGRPSAGKTATTEPSSSGCKAGAARKKVIGAVAASLLTAIYHILKDGTEHRDLGPTTSTTARPSSRPSAW